MTVNFVVGLAAVIQYAAAIWALRVLRITGRQLAWMLIAAVAFLQAIRRSIVLYHSLSHDVVHSLDLVAECVALAISILMLVGVVRIGPFFLSILRSREEARKRSTDLHERVRELNCLFGMAKLVEQPDVSLEKVIQGTVNLIPPAWRYPELTCARITVEGQVFGTTDFVESPWKLDRDIVVYGKRVGVVEVCYREKKTEEHEELFLREERHLINAIAGRLGRIIERVRVEEDRVALQEQLHQAHKMEAVGLLAAGVAHDFANLLTVVRGHTDRAAATLANQDQARKELESIQEATQQANDLTRALLTFSRKLPSEKRPVDLCSVVQESERLLRRVLPAAVILEVDVACEPPLWVDADQTQLQQVILNLAINARDAMPDGGTVCVTLSAMAKPDTHDLAEATELGGPWARLVITDTGAGMPPEVRPRVFEPFYTTKARGQGTGLGLAIVHGVVKDHGGQIKVQSEVGKGTTFTIVLPGIQAVPAHEAAAPMTITPQGTGQLILLAEDDRHVRGIIASTLESLGYAVVQAEDGPTALGIFAQQRDGIQLLVLDADLPERSGPDCLRELREAGVKTPAIVITGNVALDSDELDDESLLLRKPFGMPELAATVSEALARDARRETQS